MNFLFFLWTYSSDVSLRRELAGNIVCAGGSSMFPGMADRLQKELVNLMPPTFKVMLAIIVSSWFSFSFCFLVFLS
jgi:actin-related protein